MKQLRVLAAAAAISLALTGHLAAQQLSWKLGSAKAPPDYGATLDDQVIAAVNTASAGALNLERQILPNEQEMVQQVLRGRIQMGATSAFGVGAAIVDAPVISLPFLWRSDAERHFVTREYALPVLRELFDEKGLVLLLVGESGYNGIFCKDQCTVPADLKGKKARVSPNPVAKAFWDALGSISVQLPLSELWPGLEQGLVVAGDLPFAFYSNTPALQSAPVFVNTNHLHHPWFYFANKAEWEKLPQQTRAKILSSLPKPEDHSAQYFADLGQKMSAAKAKGVKIIDPTAEQLAAWRQVIEPILPPLMANAAPGSQKLFAAIKSGKEAFAKQGK